jgi:hypothetical protein
MARVVVVCGYDRFADLDEYAARVAALLIGMAVDAVIVSGGFTNACSDHSEAWLMSRVFVQAFPAMTVLLEEQSMNTLDNLVLSHAMAKAHFDRIDTFEVFCDGAHRRKVAILVRLLFRDGTTVRSVSRVVPWTVRFFEPLSTAIEMLGAVVPQLRPLLNRGCAFAKGVSGRAPRSALRAGV